MIISNKNEVRIRETLNSKIVSTREAAQRLAAIIRNTKAIQIELNFKDVEFVSRSFLHELKKWIDECKKTGISINLIECNKEIQKMFDVLSRSENTKRISLQSNLPSNDIESLNDLTF
jgi:hypothetical protein